ncbi:hypothetical protein [Hyalangium rubrum]|uniref:Uncharacterized protein n=1 Tax=Hyalangium rubrum TaxID=3103134 RepID=A0ABU5HDK5_9BACT|nr:hypothetical protein [Hyalangium sp. s54d21]MDY7230185.1 hypothetical protein [Hyalangium sp. s54d21]
MNLLREFSCVYVAEEFIHFLFDNRYLNFDWAGDHGKILADRPHELNAKALENTTDDEYRAFQEEADREL